MIPTADMVGLYYASRDLSAPEATPPDRFAGSDSSLLVINVPGLTQPDNFWNGATGFFSGGSTTASLRGVTFHVRKWELATKKLTLASALPIAPAGGDIFKLFKGGKYASNQEILSMKISGKQPEVDPITCVQTTGVTVKKASGLLGEGTLQIYYVATTKTISIRMGTSGSYGPEVILTGNTTNLPLYTADLSGYILVDITYASLRASSAYTESLTLSYPKGNFVPNCEGYETNDGVGRTRYHLAVVKNKSVNVTDTMSALAIWTGKPTGTTSYPTTTFAPSYTASQAITVSNASTWPTRGFWIRNRTKNDLRYVDYRSGNTLYTKPILWGTLQFTNATREIKP
ncbi:MAG: hypothetical protein ACRC2T_13545, partial [Thermoguttaceae bacterium]